MGIYADYTTGPVTKNPDDTKTWQEFEKYPGLTRVRTVTVTEWAEHERTDCYCCSCDEDNGYVTNDPFCRNHGWAGERPCERHGMAGTAGDDGIMPDSVQEVARKREEARHGASDHQG